MAIGHRTPPYMPGRLSIDSETSVYAPIFLPPGHQFMGPSTCETSWHIWVQVSTILCDGGLNMISETSVYDSYSYPPRSNLKDGRLFIISESHLK